MLSYSSKLRLDKEGYLEWLPKEAAMHTHSYCQVEIEPEDKPKTVIVTKRGLYQFKVMPFGLCNAPATFERLMETLLSGLQWDICLIYLDDIIVIAKSFNEMLQNLETVFQRLSSAGLKIKLRGAIYLLSN